MKSLLDTITSPQDLKALSFEEMGVLAFEIRKMLVSTCSKTGGHLAASLGAVELILGIHRFLDCPHDKLFFDVGHQAYAHKIITGRKDAFETLRTFGGISGFTRIAESEYDSHNSGHASDSLSTALGYAYARDLRGGTEKVVALIGDASISGGLSFEALNHMGQQRTPITIVLNDNTMSIAKNVGALSLHLARARTNARYQQTTKEISNRLSNRGTAGQLMLEMGLRARASLKQLLVSGMMFEEMGIKYIGPINGHDLREITEALAVANNAGEPVIIHCVTEKGRGYLPAEEHPDLFHGVGPFDMKTGVIEKSSNAGSTYTQVFSQALIAEACQDESIVAITAAMPQGTGLDKFQEAYPQRFFDVGIAEEHAVTMASGFALGGQRPVVAIYSTFLQRAFDEIATNVCLPNVHVVFCIDRAGIVGSDGATHTGAFDLAYLNMLPNMTIMAPSNEAELVSALHTALRLDGPVAIRYPKGSGDGCDVGEVQTFEVGQGRMLKPWGDVALLAVGSMVPVAQQVCDLLQAQGISAGLADMRFVKPLDEGLVLEAAAKAKLLVTLEEGCQMGGFGTAVLETLAQAGVSANTLVCGLPDAFMPHGSVNQVREYACLDAESIYAQIMERLQGQQAGGGADEL